MTNRRSQLGALAGLTFSIISLLLAPFSVNAQVWLQVEGNVQLADGTPLCAIVLANGQHMFTCNESLGYYELTVPVDENGDVILFSFADGLPSRKTSNASTSGLEIITDIVMSYADLGFPRMEFWLEAVEPISFDRYSIKGSIRSNSQGVSALVLANGQYVFTSFGNAANDGTFELHVPIDSNGEVTLFAGADGFLPLKQVFDPTSQLPLTIHYEAEDSEMNTGGEPRSRANASNATTWYMYRVEQEANYVFHGETTGAYNLVIRYSNDDVGSGDLITVLLDGVEVGSFRTVDTGEDGVGWNVFRDSPSIPLESIIPMFGTITVRLDESDGYGVELDRLSLVPLASMAAETEDAD